MLTLNLPIGRHRDLGNKFPIDKPVIYLTHTLTYYTETTSYGLLITRYCNGRNYKTVTKYEPILRSAPKLSLCFRLNSVIAWGNVTSTIPPFNIRNYFSRPCRSFYNVLNVCLILYLLIAFLLVCSIVLPHERGSLKGGKRFSRF